MLYSLSHTHSHSLSSSLQQLELQDAHLGCCFFLLREFVFWKAFSVLEGTRPKYPGSMGRISWINGASPELTRIMIRIGTEDIYYNNWRLGAPNLAASKCLRSRTSSDYQRRVGFVQQ